MAPFLLSVVVPIVLVLAIICFVCLFLPRPSSDGLEQFGALFSQPGHSIPKEHSKVWSRIDDFEQDSPPEDHVPEPLPPLPAVENVARVEPEAGVGLPQHIEREQEANTVARLEMPSASLPQQIESQEEASTISLPEMPSTSLSQKIENQEQASTSSRPEMSSTSLFQKIESQVEASTSSLPEMPSTSLSQKIESQEASPVDSSPYVPQFDALSTTVEGCVIFGAGLAHVPANRSK